MDQNDDDRTVEFQQWKIVCEICGKEFISDNEHRPVNDLIVHHQDNHCAKYLHVEGLKAEIVYK